MKQFFAILFLITIASVTSHTQSLFATKYDSAKLFSLVKKRKDNLSNETILSQIKLLFSEYPNIVNKRENDTGFTLLYYAVNFNDIDVVKTILDSKRTSIETINAQYTKYQFTLLHYCCYKGDDWIPVIALFIKANANPLIQDAYERTPAYYALLGKHTKTYDFLHNSTFNKNKQK